MARQVAARSGRQTSLIMESIESFIKNTKAKIVCGENEAHYNNRLDLIELPRRDTFANPPEYYAVIFHELIHWTNHPRRLDRAYYLRFTKNFLMWDFYNSYEELIAHIGAGLLCVRFGLNPDAYTQRPAFLAHHFKKIGESADTFAAALKRARRAVRYLLNHN